MTRPPECVVFVARVHWTVGAIILVSTGLVHLALRGVPRIEFGARTFLAAGGLAAAYALAGTLVWFGAPFGKLLSRVCALLYLPRPRFGLKVWETMNLPEFRTYFRRDRRNRD